jgi:hypothetical protein
MKIWSLIEAANPPNLADLRTLALKGGHGCSRRRGCIVHAVRQLLIEPEFHNLQAGKMLGTTFATLTDEFPSMARARSRLTWWSPVENPYYQLRRGVLPAPHDVRSLLIDPLAPAQERGAAASLASGEPLGCHQHRGDQALRPQPHHRRHDGAAQERHVPDRCAALESCPRDPGAARAAGCGIKLRQPMPGSASSPRSSTSATPTPSSSSAPTGR